MDFVDNIINPTTGTIVGRAIVQNENGILTPGMFGEMRLYGRDPFDAMLVPNTAIQFDQERQFVWVVEDGKAQMRFLTLGRLVDSDRIIEDGLSPDAQLIVSGFMNLQPGAPVIDKTSMRDSSSESGNGRDGKPSEDDKDGPGAVSAASSREGR